jgi:predicted Zn-dependent protease
VALGLALLAGLWNGGAALAAGPELPPRAHKALYAAQRAADAGEDARAVEILDAYREEASASGEKVPALVHLVRGAAQYRLGRMQAAAQTFAQAVRLKPGDPDARLNLGLALWAAEKPGPAGEAFEAAFDLYRKRGGVRPELLYQAAAGHYQAGATARARAALKALWDLNPKETQDAWHRLWIQVLCDGEEWRAAERAIAGRLEVRRAERGLWRLLAQVRANDGRYAEAASALEVADVLEPLDRRDLLFLADVHAAAGAPLRAAALLERAVARDDAPDLHDRLARLLALGRRPAEALAHARKALALAPSRDRVLAVGQLLSVSGDRAALEALCREHARNDAESGELLLLAAVSAIQARAWGEARGLLGRAADDPKVRPRAVAWRAVLDDLESVQREAQAAAQGSPS